MADTLTPEQRSSQDPRGYPHILMVLKCGCQMNFAIATEAGIWAFNGPPRCGRHRRALARNREVTPLVVTGWECHNAHPDVVA